MSPTSPLEETSWALRLGRLARERRRSLGLTQGAVADLAGCGTAFLYALEHGKPSLQLDKVVDVLRVLGLQLRVESGLGELVVGEELA